LIIRFEERLAAVPIAVTVLRRQGQPQARCLMPRRFPTAWSAERIPGSFVVKDATGQSLAYVYASERRLSSALLDMAKAHRP
jgi:hypothetical protein